MVVVGVMLIDVCLFVEFVVGVIFGVCSILLDELWEWIDEFFVGLFVVYC